LRIMREHKIDSPALRAALFRQVQSASIRFRLEAADGLLTLGERHPAIEDAVLAAYHQIYPEATPPAIAQLACTNERFAALLVGELGSDQVTRREVAAALLSPLVQHHANLRKRVEDALSDARERMRRAARQVLESAISS
jgi:hypothetical protein